VRTRCNARFPGGFDFSGYQNSGRSVQLRLGRSLRSVAKCSASGGDLGLSWSSSEFTAGLGGCELYVEPAAEVPQGSAPARCQQVLEKWIIWSAAAKCRGKHTRRPALKAAMTECPGRHAGEPGDHGEGAAADLDDMARPHPRGARGRPRGADSMPTTRAYPASFPKPGRLIGHGKPNAAGAERRDVGRWHEIQFFR